MDSEDSDSDVSDDERKDPTLLEDELEQEEEDNNLFEENLEAEAWSSVSQKEAVLAGKGQSDHTNRSTKVLVSMGDSTTSNGHFDRIGTDYVEHINRQNARLVYSHVARAVARGASAQEALRTAASLPFDMVMDDDKMTAKERRQTTQVETRPQRLFDIAVEERGLTHAMEEQGMKFTRGKRVKSKRAAKERTFAVPRGISVADFSTLYGRLSSLASKKDFFVIAIPSAPADVDGDYRTMVIRIPPVIPDATGATSARNQVQRFAHAVLAPFHRSHKWLRSTAYHMRLAGVMKPSRGTEQSYWGYSAPSACEAATRATAWGVDEGNYVDNHPSKHHSLRIPTFVHHEYVAEGEICLAEHLKQTIMAQHKHSEEMVSSGFWPGPCNEVFGNGIEALGEASSSALLLLFAAASPDHAKAFLRSVPKSVRLGGKQSLAIHTTEAFYGTGSFLAEAEAYLAKVQSEDDDFGETAASPGALLQESASSCIEEHCSWAMPKLAQGIRSTLKAEQSRCRERLDTMKACFIKGTAAAARHEQNDLASRGRINKNEIRMLPLLLSN